MIKSFLIHSKQKKSNTIYVSGMAPYYDSLDSISPVISVHVSGDLSTFTGYTSTDYIRAIGCARPSGATPITDVLDLISGYCYDGTNFNSDTISYNNIRSNNDFTIYNEYYKGTPPTFKNAISGNAYYDVYASHVLLSNTSVIGTGSVVVTSGLLTHAPAPDPNKVIITMNDYGDSFLDGTSLLTFDIELKQPSNFANTDKFGVGYPGLASSGLAQISCSGITSGVYFPNLFDGSNQSNTPLYQYGSVGTVLQWKVPIKCNAGYADYQFDVKYINSSGILSPSTSFKFTSDAVKTLVTDDVKDNVQDIKSNTKTFNQIEVRGVTGRSRLSLGLRDIDLISTIYNQTGKYVSSMYTSEKPIYALSLNTNESSYISNTVNIWDIVKYYIQFNSSGSWYQISPKPRINEVDNTGKSVPSVIILDSSTFDKERIDNLYNRVSFISLDKEQYNFRVKIEMDTTITGLQGSWTPMIYDYRVSVIDREAIVGSNFERYLFN